MNWPAEGGRTAEVLPFEPGLWTSDLPGVGGRIGPDPEDFQVDEVPLYAASGSGQHYYVRIKKRGVTTPQMIRFVAKASGVNEREIGFSGLKDKHAVTSQWVSVLDNRALPPERWELPEALEILEVSRHGNKLRTGHLAGNRFRIRLVELTGEHLDERSRTLAERLAEGYPNFFGAQRFGVGGQGLKQALEWVRGKARGSRFEAKFLPSVIQAEHFNRYLAARWQLSFERPLLGEVVRLEGTQSSFAVDDPVAELPRWLARDIHPRGPLVGPKMKAALHDAAKLEQTTLDELELTSSDVRRLGKFAPGSRRDLIVFPRALATHREGPTGLVLDFELPSGSYATQLVREFTRAPFLSSASGSFSASDGDG